MVSKLLVPNLERFKTKNWQNKNISMDYKYINETYWPRLKHFCFRKSSLT